MSTKATIAHDDDFHFYEEIMDTHHVYLEMSGTHYEAGYNRVMLPIPIHIWEVIRKRGGPDLSLADMTDDQLRDHVAQQVDERIAAYQKSLAEDALHTRFFAYVGSIPFGSADTPREEQMAQDIEYYRAKRQNQQEIKAAIETLEAKNAHRGNR